VSTPAKASVLVHQLQLRIRRSQETEEIFIALDDGDLTQLKEAVEEAIAKSTLLQAAEKAAGRILIRS
jgi:hypothetical protein